MALVSGGTNSHGAPSLLSLSQRFQVDDREEERGLEPSEVGTRSGCRSVSKAGIPEDIDGTTRNLRGARWQRVNSAILILMVCSFLESREQILG